MCSWQLVATLVDLEGLEIDAEPLGAWRPLDAAFAAQDTRCGSERSTEGLLALRFGVLDKGCPVDLIKPLANAAVVHGPGLVLREQSAPPLGSLHILGRSAKGDALLASEAEQQQVLLANHRGAITSSLKGSASRSMRLLAIWWRLPTWCGACLLFGEVCFPSCVCSLFGGVCSCFGLRQHTQSTAIHGSLCFGDACC
jgi:hypothetical protein